MPPAQLLDQGTTTTALRHLSSRTTEADRHRIRRFILFQKRSKKCSRTLPEPSISWRASCRAPVFDSLNMLR